MQVTEKIGGKGPQVLGCLDQPVQHRIGIDLKGSSGGADTQAFSQTGQDAHDALDRHLFAVENRAVGLQKVPLTRGTVELTPGAAAGMAIGAQIAQTEPASVVTRIRISKGFFAQPPRECSRWQRLGARRRAVLRGLARSPRSGEG